MDIDTLDKQKTITRRSPADEVQWLLDFIQAEPDTLKGPTLLERRQRLAQLMGLPFTGLRKDGKGAGSATPTAKDVHDLHGTLSRKFKALAQGEPWTLRMGAKVTLHLDGGKVRTLTVFEPEHEADRTIIGAIRPLLAVQNRLRICANKKCRRLFLGVRQKYCSMRCQHTDAKQRYRQGKRGSGGAQQGGHTHDVHP